MQDVNNDMDDLFRKAAEHYPLQTGGADWGKVLAALKDEDDAPIPVVPNNKQKRKKRALWLLLLLPLCLLYLPLHNYSFINNSEGKTKQSALQKNTTAINKNTSGKTTQSLPDFSHNNTSSETKNSHDEIIINTHSSAQRFDAKGNKLLNNTTSVLANPTRDQQQVAALTSPNIITTHTATNEAVKSSSSKASTNNEITLKNNSANKQPDETTTRIETITTGDENKKRDVQKEVMVNEATAINKNDSAVVKKDSLATKKKKEAKAQTQQQQGFYAGLSGSFDMSTVKLQRIEKTGYGLQVLAGYRFSTHLSAETGVGWSSKNYYSTGKYFDKKKANIPDAVEIYFSNGNCKMLEIPVSLKYDFAIHKKSSLFATAGLSSYFMKKENYFYHGNYRSNNMSWVYDTTRYYKNSGNNLLSVIDLSIGYQLQINKHSTLRIEPYLKLPLHGIGIANMPITSTGISVGFTRRF